MTAEKYLYNHYGTNKTSQPPEQFDFNNVIDMMKHYAKIKCKEQRSLCAKSITRTSLEHSTVWVRHEIEQAHEPEFD